MNTIVQSWMDAYLRAWESNDPEDIRVLFTTDATYAGDPFDPAPWVGADAIVRSWLEHRDEPGTWTFEGSPLAFDHGVGVIQGRTEYTDGRVYANLWVVTFDPAGRASSFVEWFMQPRSPDPATV